jgi:hypothetical protein
VNYFRIGQSGRCFSKIRHWVEMKIRRHLMRARLRKGKGWKRWSSEWIYRRLGLYNDYRLRRPALAKAAPTVPGTELRTTQIPESDRKRIEARNTFPPTSWRCGTTPLSNAAPPGLRAISSTGHPTTPSQTPVKPTSNP